MHIFDHTNVGIELLLVVVILGARLLVRGIVLGNRLERIKHSLGDFFISLIDSVADVQPSIQVIRLELRFNAFDESLRSVSETLSNTGKILNIRRTPCRFFAVTFISSIARTCSSKKR